MPPKPKTPTPEQRKQVKTLSGFGLNHVQVANVMDISRPTLEKYYSEELRKGKDEAIALVTNSLFSNIKKGNVPCILFYLKCQAGWKERDALELTPSTIDKIVAGVGRSRSMSHEEWTKFAEEQRAKSKQKAAK
jgi:hypothetical protein